MKPVLIVTAPPDADLFAFARHARAAGAERMELRSDLHTLENLDVTALNQAIPLLLSQRTPKPIPSSPFGAWQDVPLEHAVEADIVSHHSPHAMAPNDVVTLWLDARVGATSHLKHVEPMGTHADANRLLETQRLLGAAFGAHRVTVLCTGEQALPWRCVLAQRNALDYVALSPSWRAALGQRLLADSRRTRGAIAARFGILGHALDASRSPRIHPPPFDRLDLPPSTDVGALLLALHPHYAGFAVTSPFKRAVARACASPSSSVNTLWRTTNGWSSANTDVIGGQRVLARLPAGPVTVLGDGGVTDALREAASTHPLRILKREHAGVSVDGNVVWTWPAHIEPPRDLVLTGARVVVVAYGPPAWRIAQQVRARGGTPLMLGPTWLVAQAREQRRLWKDAQ